MGASGQAKVQVLIGECIFHSASLRCYWFFGHQRSFYFVRPHASSFHAGLHGATRDARVGVGLK